MFVSVGLLRIVCFFGVCLFVLILGLHVSFLVPQGAVSTFLRQLLNYDEEQQEQQGEAERAAYEVLQTAWR